MKHRIAPLFGLLLLPACRVLEVDSAGGPPRIQSRGWIDSHVALGIPSESHLVHLDLFDGTSDGAVAELTLWKLLHLELGLAGFSVGVGPIHVGLGILFYEPEVPATMGSRPARGWRDSRDWDDEAEDEAEESSIQPEEAPEPAEDSPGEPEPEPEEADAVHGAPPAPARRLRS